MVHKMKKFAFILLLFFFGCIATPAKPEDVLKNAINSSAKVDNYLMRYEVNMSLGGQSALIGVSMYKKGNLLRTDGVVEDFQFITYVNGNETTICVKENEWLCEPYEGNEYNFEDFGVTKFMENMQKGLDLNAINLSTNISERRVANRLCNMLYGTMNLSKMNGSGISHIAQCLDKTTGFPLLFSMETKNTDGTIKMTMLVTEFETGTVDETFFEMPA